MGKISWLHTSDLHIYPPISKGVLSHFDQGKVLQDFILFLKNRFPTELRTPDLIFVTGDLAFSGKKEDYFGPTPNSSKAPCVNDFLIELGNCLGFNPSELPRRVHFVPGNHDVCRDMVNDEESEKANLRRTKSRDAITDLLLSYQKTDLRDIILKRLNNYGEFYRKFKSEHTTPLFDLLWHNTIFQAEDGSPSVSIIGLCSSWLSQSFWRAILKPNGFEDDEEPSSYLALCDTLVEQKTNIEKKDLTIALIHHNFETLAEVEKDHVRKSLEKNCDFVLCGHVHKDRLWVRPIGGKAHIIQSGSLFLQRDYRNAFNIVEVDTNSRIGKMVVIEYHKDEWTIDKKAVQLTAGDYASGYKFDNNTGILTFQLDGVPSAPLFVSDSPENISRKTKLFPDYFCSADIEKLWYITTKLMNNWLLGNKEGNMLEKYQFDAIKFIKDDGSCNEHLDYLLSVFPEYTIPIGLEHLDLKTKLHFYNSSRTVVAFKVEETEGILDEKRWRSYGFSASFHVYFEKYEIIYLKPGDGIIVNSNITISLKQIESFMDNVRKVESWVVPSIAFWELIQLDIKGLKLNIRYVSGEVESMKFGIKVNFSGKDKKISKIDVNKVLFHLGIIKSRCDEYSKILLNKHVYKTPEGDCNI